MSTRLSLRAVTVPVLVVLGTVVVLELLFRGYFAVRMGPRMLLYGTSGFRDTKTVPIPPENPNFHDNAQGEYSKYFPNELKWHGKFRIRINNQGFRGPDFTTEKPPGVLRVLTLGASSTFGFGDADDETYPHYLQQILDRRSQRRFEVINFAIPHATSDNIVAMFLAEGTSLAPDVVTFYEGANDSVLLASGANEAGWRQAAHYSLLVQTLNELRGARVWTWDDGAIAAARKHFLSNVARLESECRRRGIHFIVVTQQLRSGLIPNQEMPGLTYEAEMRRFNQRVADNGWDSFGAVERIMAGTFLVHTQMMADLRTWAAERHVPLVDGIVVLDGKRDLMMSFVHLQPELNRMLADAIASAILTLVDRPD
jgi:lysophospholipase L1-like esterase